MQVFDIEDMGGKGKEDRAVVARPRDCTMCRYVNPLSFLPSLSCPPLPFPSFPFLSYLPAPSFPLHIISFLIFVSCLTLNYTILYRILLYSTVLCCTVSECIRKEGWSDRVQLNRVADHFIFTVESSGCIPPEIIVREVSETASICPSICPSVCLSA